MGSALENTRIAIFFKKRPRFDWSKEDFPIPVNLQTGLAPVRSHSRLNCLAISLLVAVASVVAFYPVLGNDFINYDDDVYITENPHVQRGLTRESIAWAFTTNHRSNWHPVTWISHMLDAELYGHNPLGYHLTNLLFHIGNALLLFFLLHRMTGYVWRSAFVAVLFALHPLHVESVAWAAERKDVLSTFFWMLAMLAYAYYSERPAISRYLLVVLAFTLGLMSKPMLVTLPVVLLLVDYWPLGRFVQTDSGEKRSDGRRWRLVWEKTPLFALSLASSLVTLWAQKAGGAIGTLEQYVLTDRIANAVVTYVVYIWKMIWPTGLAVFYPHPEGTLPFWQVVGAFLLMTLMTVLAFRMKQKLPYFLVGWLWYTLTLIPVIGLIQVGWQSMADRYTYIPLIGLFIIIAWGISDLCRRYEACRPLHLLLASGVVVAALGVCTWNQASHWHDSVSLFRHALEVTSHNYVARNNLAEALVSEGQFAEAAPHFQAAIELKPDNPVPHVNLGNVLSRLGDTNGAIFRYREALKIKPDLAEAHCALANALLKQRRIDDAIYEYRQALSHKRDYIKAYYNLGNALQMKGRLAEAENAYKQAIRIDPKHAAAHHNLGYVLEEQGRRDEAIVQYREAIRWKPALGQAHNSLAVALYFKGDYVGAWKEVRLAQKCGFKPNPGFLAALSKKMRKP